MFDQNKKPKVKTIFNSDERIVGIIDISEGRIGIILNDSTVKIVNSNGDELNTLKLFDNDSILSFIDYNSEIWITTKNRKLCKFTDQLQLEESFALEEQVTSVAPLGDRSGVVLSYYDGKSTYFEHRSLPGFDIISKGYYGPHNSIISSVAFFDNDELYLACCAEDELALIREEGDGMVNIQSFCDESGDGELRFSQLLARSKKFLIDNMTCGVKESISPEKYMGRICFMRNGSATHGAIDVQDHWVVFLNPDCLKINNHLTQKSVSFETTISKPWHVKILKYQILCSDGFNIQVWEFRSNSLHFIIED
jgi:hypothetical protein